MPKIFDEYFYKFFKDIVWELAKYIGPLFFGAGGFLVKGWIAAFLLAIGSFLSLTYIKYLFDRQADVKGKLIYRSFGVFNQSIENRSDHNYAYFEVCIVNCSYDKIFFKISEKSSFQIHDRTKLAKDSYFEELTASIYSILPKQIFTIQLPEIEVPTSPEILNGVLNIGFEYGKKDTDLKYTAEFEITCKVVYREKVGNEQLKTLTIENWKISKSNI
jgi:hypothetical protein